MSGAEPDDIAGLLTETDAAEAKAAVERLRERGRTRLDTARAAFEDGHEDETR
jgi:exonuclease VII small subunit